MANVNAPFGFSPARTTLGAAWNEQANIYCIPSTDTNQYQIGDMVISLAGSDAAGIPYVVKGAASGIARGVIVGQRIVQATDPLIIPATKTRDYYVFVVDDPNVVFEAQCDNTSTLTAANVIGKNANFVVANPSGISVVSGTVVDSTSFATTSTLPLKVLGLRQKPGDDFTSYAKLLVKFNRHEFFGSTAGV